MPSRSTTRISQADNRNTATDSSTVIAPRLQQGSGGSAAQASQGGTAINGWGNSITLTDNGAVKSANEIVGKALDAQANLAASAIGAANSAASQIKQLAETRLTDGGNIQNKTLQTVLIAVAGLAAAVVLFRK